VAANSQWRNESQKIGAAGDTIKPNSGASWEKRMMDRLAAGDEAAMMLLYDRYSRLVYSVAANVLNDKHIAEDVAQEVFLHVWRSARSFNSERGTLGGWLAIITRHRAIDVLRRRKRECIIGIDKTPDVNSHSHAESSEAVTRMAAAFPLMPASQRVVLGLAYFSGLSHSEISSRTGEPLGTVKSRIRLALEFLRKTLVSRESLRRPLPADPMRKKKRK
jgi:RNA polymerase sigma-70 factor, ECF subfamily